MIRNKNIYATIREYVKNLENQLREATERYKENEESNKAVEIALEDADYKGSYADGVEYLKKQLAIVTEERDKEQDLNKCYHGELSKCLIQRDALAAELTKLRSEQAEGKALVGKDLHYELAGVIADVELGNGFDDVCLNTIKRVHDALLE